jgi:hypothetical protein
MMSYNDLSVAKDSIVEQELIGDNIKLIKESSNKIIVVSIIKKGKYVFTCMLLDEKSNALRIVSKMTTSFALPVNKNQIALLNNSLVMIGENTLLVLDVNKESNEMGDWLEAMFKSRNYQAICSYVLSKSNGKYTLDKYKHIIEFATNKLEEISTPKDPNSLNHYLTQLMISIASPDSSASAYTYGLTNRDKKKKARVLIAQEQSSLITIKGILNAVLERIERDSVTIKNCLELEDVREIDSSSHNQVVKKIR